MCVCVYVSGCTRARANASPFQITQIKQGFAAIVQKHSVVGIENETGRKEVHGAFKLHCKVGLIA